jgi:phage terminase large subunit-like protein
VSQGDDWLDEKVWVKANPNLGVSKKWDDVRRKAKRALEMPAAQNAFLRLELNVWTQSVTKWINWQKWEGCGMAVDPVELSKKLNFIAGCLSIRIDNQKVG